MNILYVASECYPFITIGESGYVAHSLPKNLSDNEDMDIRVLLPNFAGIPGDFRDKFKRVGSGSVKLNWRTIDFTVELAVHEGVKHYFISNDYYFGREKSYGYHDDAERFAFFSKATLAALDVIKFKPDLIHCNNTPASLIPLYLHELKNVPSEKGKVNKFKNIKTLYTIHSLKYHGLVHVDQMEDILGISEEEYFTDDKLRYHDYASFLKAGVVYSDAISTVSTTYMKELLTPEVAGDLAGLFNFYKKKFYGIKNGIDYSNFDPKSDKELHTKYGISNFTKRVANKLALQEELGLEVDASIPVIAVLSKLDDERGIELISEEFHELLKEKVQIVIIGNGLEKYEDFFDYYSYVYPNKVFSSSFNFKEHTTSKKVLSGVDFLLTPSKTEPCGLIQMLALRYGVLTIGRSTGGLIETLNSDNSFTFKNYSSQEMVHTIKLALETYRNDSTKLHSMITKAMRSNNSWTNPTKKYVEIYNKIIL